MNIKRSYTGSVINTNNLDISKEQQQSKESIIELLNSSSDNNNKLLIQWSNNFVDPQQLIKGKSINHTKIIDYFSMLPDYGSSQDSGGLLTQVCQTHNLRDINNDEPDVKKAKTCSNDKSTKAKNKINLNNLLNDINEFNRFFTNEQQKTVNDQQEEREEQQSSPSSAESKKLNEFDQLKLNDNNNHNLTDYSSLQSPFLTNKHLNNKQQRTSTPRATSKSLFNTKPDQQNKPTKNKTPPPPPPQPQQQLPTTISDDSLVIALSQFESDPPITDNQQQTEQANTVVQQQPQKPINSHKQQQPQQELTIKRKKFQFSRHNTNTNNDKSFSRFKSDPLNTSTKIQSDNNKNQQITSSSQSNTTKYEDDDDDDVNLLLNDQNLLKIIDSKQNQQINDTFERNRVVKKAPSLPQLTNSFNKNKLIQVPSSKVGLKIQRLTSSDSLNNNQNHPQQQQSNKQANKNFYGNNNNNNNNQTTVDHNSNNTTKTTSQQQQHKYTNEQIEFKRQQALLRLKNKAK